MTTRNQIEILEAKIDEHNHKLDAMMAGLNAEYRRAVEEIDRRSDYDVCGCGCGEETFKGYYNPKLPRARIVSLGTLRRFSRWVFG